MLIPNDINRQNLPRTNILYNKSQGEKIPNAQNGLEVDWQESNQRTKPTDRRRRPDATAPTPSATTESETSLGNENSCEIGTSRASWYGTNTMLLSEVMVLGIVSLPRFFVTYDETMNRMLFGVSECFHTRSVQEGTTLDTKMIHDITLNAYRITNLQILAERQNRQKGGQQATHGEGLTRSERYHDFQ